MANSARMNFEMPVLLINLKRQADRRKQSLKVLRELGFTKIHVVDAIDGLSLLRECSGRARKTTKTQWRLTYNVDGTRKTFPLKTSGLGNAGGCDLWGQHACAQSHRLCVEKTQRLFQRNVEAVLVVEDDLCLPPLLSADEFQQSLKRVWKQLSDSYPDWTGFWLGGTGVFSIGATNGPTQIQNVRFADWVMQAHAYMLRRTSKSRDVLRSFVDKVGVGGLMADNAWAALMRTHRGLFFYSEPNLVLQDSKTVSSLQYVSEKGGQKGYEESRKIKKLQPRGCVAMKARANMPSQLKKALGRDRRGHRPIRKQNLKRIRQTVGQKGGFKKAGGTSNAKDVRKKEQGMQKYFERHGVFPTKKFSAEKWKASTVLWARVRKECLGEIQNGR